jgi:hypothetical protein
MTSVSGAEKLKLNCLPEAKLRIAAPTPFLFTTDLKKFHIEKIMVSEEVFVNCYNFNPITSVKKR